MISNNLRYDDFADIVSLGSSMSLAPDDRTLAYSCDLAGQFDLWTLDIDSGAQRRLTSLPERAVRQVEWMPDGASILFLADWQGNEQHQLFLADAATGEVRQLTDRPDVQHFLAAVQSVSPDGRAIVYAGNDREPTAQDLLLADLASGEQRRLVADGGIYEASAWSPDGQRVSAYEIRSNTHAVPIVVDVATGAIDRIAIGDGPSSTLPGPWFADGSGFWMSSDFGRDYTGLYGYQIGSAELSPIDTPDWDVEAVGVSRDGSLLVWSVNEGGVSRLRARSVESGAEVELPEIPAGVLRSGLVVSSRGERIVFQLATAAHPAEIFMFDIARCALVRLTSSWRRGGPPAPMREPTLVTIEAFDGLQIPAWLYRPAGDGPFPVVVSIHGGPEWQERPSYNYRGLYQYWLQQEIGVLAPNIRGSTGYGKPYQRLIHRDLGGNDLHDFEACARFLRALDWVDGDRIGAFGGSYGGFAVLSCLSRLPDHWAAGVDIVGPSNLVTMLRSFPPTWQEIAKETFGDVETEEADLLRRSPITYVDQIRAPLFVLQGANDPRVVQAESDQIVERLRARGVPVRYDVYEDEGHGFVKTANQLRAYRDAAAFLLAHLRAGGPTR